MLYHRIFLYFVASFFLQANFYALGTETNYLFLAINSSKESIIAGQSNNDIAMLDNLESARDYAIYAQEQRANAHIKIAVTYLGEAISHIIASNDKEALKDTLQALQELERAGADSIKKY